MLPRTKLKLIIYAVLLVLAIATLLWWWGYARAQGRDYQRLGDMRVLEAALNSYFFEFNTYQVPECGAGSLVNFCVGRDRQQLPVTNLVDPLNTDNWRYLVAELGENDFRVEFYLETGAAGLPAGQYALTKEGLGK